MRVVYQRRGERHGRVLRRVRAPVFPAGGIVSLSLSGVAADRRADFSILRYWRWLLRRHDSRVAAAVSEVCGRAH